MTILNKYELRLEKTVIKYEELTSFNIFITLNRSFNLVFMKDKDNKTVLESVSVKTSSVVVVSYEISLQTNMTLVWGTKQTFTSQMFELMFNVVKL